MAKSAPSGQERRHESKTASSDQRGDERPKGRRMANRYQNIRRQHKTVKSGREGAEWSGRRVVRKLSIQEGTK